jgi:hypothetical protein
MTIIAIENERTLVGMNGRTKIAKAIFEPASDM